MNETETAILGFTIPYVVPLGFAYLTGDFYTLINDPMVTWLLGAHFGAWAAFTALEWDKISARLKATKQAWKNGGDFDDGN
tara:strand:- start:615 stop:857 length:243 start_codon:yes stop_codon:yes gene_type:complete